MSDLEKNDISIVSNLSEKWFFVFVGFGHTVPNSFHVLMDDPDDLKGSLEKAYKHYPFSLDPGEYAVFIHHEDDFRYIYYRTIVYKGENNALSCDSE